MHIFLSLSYVLATSPFSVCSICICCMDMHMFLCTCVDRKGGNRYAYVYICGSKNTLQLNTIKMKVHFMSLCFQLFAFGLLWLYSMC